MPEDIDAAGKEKARQLSSTNDTKAGGGGCYTPKPIAYRLGVGETQVEENISIPNRVVGFTISRRNEIITSMQQRMGCCV